MTTQTLEKVTSSTAASLGKGPENALAARDKALIEAINKIKANHLENKAKGFEEISKIWMAELKVRVEKFLPKPDPFKFFIDCDEAFALANSEITGNAPIRPEPKKRVANPVLPKIERLFPFFIESVEEYQVHEIQEQIDTLPKESRSYAYNHLIKKAMQSFAASGNAAAIKFLTELKGFVLDEATWQGAFDEAMKKRYFDVIGVLAAEFKKKDKHFRKERQGCILRAAIESKNIETIRVLINELPKDGNERGLIFKDIFFAIAADHDRRDLLSRFLGESVGLTPQILQLFLVCALEENNTLVIKTFLAPELSLFKNLDLTSIDKEFFPLLAQCAAKTNLKILKSVCSLCEKVHEKGLALGLALNAAVQSKQWETVTWVKEQCKDWPKNNPRDADEKLFEEQCKEVFAIAARSDDPQNQELLKWLLEKIDLTHVFHLSSAIRNAVENHCCKNLETILSHPKVVANSGLKELASEAILFAFNKAKLPNTFQEENRTPIARLLQSVNLSWTDRALLVANTANGEQKTVINELLRDHYVQHCGGSGVGWSVLSSILLSWLMTNLILLFRGNPSNESEIPTYIGDIDAKDIW